MSGCIWYKSEHTTWTPPSSTLFLATKLAPLELLIYKVMFLSGLHSASRKLRRSLLIELITKWYDCFNATLNIARKTEIIMSLDHHLRVKHPALIGTTTYLHFAPPSKQEFTTLLPSVRNILLSWHDTPDSPQLSSAISIQDHPALQDPYAIGNSTWWTYAQQIQIREKYFSLLTPEGTQGKPTPLDIYLRDAKRFKFSESDE